MTLTCSDASCAVRLRTSTSTSRCRQWARVKASASSAYGSPAAAALPAAGSAVCALLGHRMPEGLKATVTPSLGTCTCGGFVCQARLPAGCCDLCRQECAGIGHLRCGSKMLQLASLHEAGRCLPAQQSVTSCAKQSRAQALPSGGGRTARIPQCPPPCHAGRRADTAWPACLGPAG